MTELLEGAAEVRGTSAVPLQAVRTDGGWRRVEEVAAHWRVETDWWRTPVRRDYARCLLDNGDCVELFLDLATGSWHWARRLD